MQSLINIKSILLGFFLLCLITINYFNRWQPKTILQNDSKYYYSYLPLFFIDESYIIEVDSTFLPNNPTKSIKMSSGLALLWFPFFGIAHFIALNIESVLPNGYSFPYSIALVFSNMLFTLLGLYIVYLILHQLHFNIRIRLSVVVSLFIGTTLYYYSTFELMPHTYLFTGIALFVYLVLKWWNQLTILRSMLIGLIYGWVILTRPIDAIIILPLLIYMCISFTLNDIKFYFFKNIQYIFAFSFSSLLIVSIQLFYWKYQTGSWIHWSYGSENFYFLNPHILDGLLGFRKGWFIYTPLMLLACIGIIMSPKRIALSLGVFLFLFCYIIFSWWNWWYGGSLGCRSILDVYVFLAIGLAYFYQYILNHNKKYVKILLSAITILFVLYGLKLNIQGFYEWIHWDGMTYTSWKKSIIMLKPNNDYWKTIKRPNEKKQLETGEEY
jgi:hypothetical protein